MAERPRLGESYTSNLEQVLSIYGLDRDKIGIPINALVNSTLRLLGEYQMDPSFLDNPEKCLFAMSVAFSWQKTESFKDRRALLSVLKTLAVPDKVNSAVISDSNKVREQSLKKKKKGVIFDPKTPDEYFRRTDFSPTEYSKSYFDPGLTEAAENEYNNWGRNSLLRPVRKRLGLTIENQVPVLISVLNRNAEALYLEMGFGGICMNYGFLSNIILPSDWWLFLPHEYAHSQSIGINFGLRRHLLRGLNEALTENSIRNPLEFFHQRLILKYLDMQIPGFMDIAYEAYMGNTESRTQMFRLLAEKYGLEGLLTIARMDGRCSHLFSDDIQDRIYLGIDQVKAFFIASEGIPEY